MPEFSPSGAAFTDARPNHEEDQSLRPIEREQSGQILIAQLRASRQSTGPEGISMVTIDEEMELSEKRNYLADYFLKLLKRFDQPELQARLAAERKQLARLAESRPANTIPTRALLGCYNELQNVYENFSAVDFSARANTTELIRLAEERLLELKAEVDELLGSEQPLSPAQQTVESDMPSKKTRPLKKTKGRLPGIRAFALAAAGLLSNPSSPHYDEIPGARPNRTHPEVRLPDQGKLPRTEVSPAYEIFREMGADLDTNALSLKTAHLERALYWVFLEAGKDKNITHRPWKDVDEVNGQARWAAKWAAKLLAKGRVNKKFITRQTLDIKALAKITEYKNSQLIIRDTAAFYEMLVKPLLDFKRH